ncbi:MAG: PDZ domain-containing protein, partial [Peptococcaceae bacterium]|nr:PDZ domain-containing protein [Peptococcaceae bacterium]
MVLEPGLVVASVRQGSLAEEMEIEPGDKIVRINGQAVFDLIDFLFLVSDDYLQVDVVKANGEQWQLEIDREPGEEFGIEFATVAAEGIKHCRNKCIFCFVDQMPPGMRPTLYEKDDDYRLSLTQGSFITLTNQAEDDLQRILKLHLSPLYVSVQATDPEIRRQLLNNPGAGNVLQQLKTLAQAGIVMHTQMQF